MTSATSSGSEITEVSSTRTYTTSAPHEPGEWGELNIPSRIALSRTAQDSPYVTPAAPPSARESLDQELEEWQSAGMRTLAHLDDYIDELEETEDEEG